MRDVDEQDAIRVMEKYGSSDPDFVIPLIRQIAKLGIKVIHFDPDIIKHALSFVRGIRPGDEIEALLGYHMAAVDQALNFNFGRVNEARLMQYNVEERNADRAVNWSARTSIALEKAFHRHQNQREQKLTVRPMTAANGHSTKPKRGIKNVNTLMNGVERHGHPRNTAPMLASCRCGAKTRSGRRCRSPAVRRKARCRMHGGAVGSGAPPGNKNALKHGRYTSEGFEERQQLRNLLREARALIKAINEANEP